MSIESPSSSVSTNAYLFHDVKGNQLRIFTESTIQGRPKLVASLKKAGAINAHIKNAQIILVDSFAESAKSLAAVWRDKVVLDVGWAYQAIGRGSYQGEDEDWGGHCVRGDSVDDGVLPTHASAKSPLPTPRQMPTQRTTFSHVESPASSSRIPRRSEMVAGPSTSSPQSLSHPSTSSMILPPSSQTPNLVDGGLLQHDIAPSQRPPSILPSMPSQLTENAASSSQQQSLSGAFITPDAARALVFGMFGQAFGTVLLQAVQHHETNSPYPHSPIFQPPSPAMSNTVHPYQDHRDETVSARNSVPGPSMTLCMKEKRRETFMEPIAKRPRLSTGAGLQPIFRTESGEPLAFFVSMDLNNRSDIVDLIKKNGGKIYADIPHADIVVLAPCKKSFVDHLMAAVTARKPAVQATFVHQCVLGRTLLDPGDFSFEGFEAKNRKNQAFTVCLDDLEDRASPPRKSKDGRRKKRSESTGLPTKASPSKQERSLGAEPLVEAEVQHTLAKKALSSTWSDLPNMGDPAIQTCLLSMLGDNIRQLLTKGLPNDTQDKVPKTRPLVPYVDIVLKRKRGPDSDNIPSQSKRPRGLPRSSD
ncbi:hypothetical protein PHLCEN_2v13351 [Hermanssonia centrifuga]|uniref:BRCT domain-containing protein n=1 Tax=Hermanssonia centrifuga TaxID=98765 RepID=A0A2R6NER6_9APHY|nr:hypothetical protein PHLCEN_2v13351 [Hermanssonia centrifuga]